jgi:hypothetical protein
MDKLEGMKDQRARIEARIIQLQARDRTKRRKMQTRAKIVLGEAVVVLAYRDSNLLATLLGELPKLVPQKDCKLVIEFLKDPSA